MEMSLHITNLIVNTKSHFSSSNEGYSLLKIKQASDGTDWVNEKWKYAYKLQYANSLRPSNAYMRR